MKRWPILGGMAIATLLLAVLWLHGQARPVAADADKKDKRTISTSGSATIKVKPDSARLFFSVQTIAKTVKSAREENSAKAKTVLDALKALHIPDLKMKTANVNVELLQAQHNQATLPEILGYHVTNSFTVLVQNGDAVKLSADASRILDTVLENGANQIQQIVFFKQNETAIRREALTKAVQEALANARALAAGGNVDLKETITIDGQPEYYYGGRMQMQTNAAFVGGGDGETPIVAGDLEITCRVGVTCAY
ncbi:MAG TPA: SIMPL domain-containing protein [Gemmataceae bacterium]|jgi:uncharacterized protein YggE|nr:SIMPL domain-containing protein [Gemmataceae bacterium]